MIGPHCMTFGVIPTKVTESRENIVVQQFRRP